MFKKTPIFIKQKKLAKDASFLHAIKYLLSELRREQSLLLHLSE